MAEVTTLSIQDLRAQVLDWVGKEWAAYGDTKWDTHRQANQDHMEAEGYGADGYWWNQILTYLKRAQIYGLENPAGRQAAMKTTTTLIDSLCHMIAHYGLPPAPGQTSGETREWK